MSVLPALVAGIHADGSELERDVDARLNAGHDEGTASTRRDASHYRTSSFIAVSSPEIVSGYIRSLTSFFIRPTDSV